MALKSLFFLLVISFGFSAAKAVSPNDVTVLLPLPLSADFSQLLGTQDQGPLGKLLSTKAYSKFNQMVPEHKNDVVWNDQLKVIGLRIDPCFVEGEGPVACRRQVRLVWQPIVFKKNLPEARDAAIHSFYDFDEKQFEQLKTAWFKVASGKDTDSLQIQPQILQEGWQGKYWQNLRQVILQNCGEKNLARMTTMNVMSGEQLWIFAGFDLVNGEPEPIKIPRFFAKFSQGVISGSSAFKGFTGGLMPTPEADSEVGEFLKDSFAFKKNYSEDHIRSLIAKIKEYEDPKKHNPGTLDCASCHMADAIHRWGKFHYPNWDWSEKSSAPGPLRTNQLRAFGYFMMWPVTSQRVINETEEVVKAFAK